MALNLENHVNFLKELSEWDMGLAGLEFRNKENTHYFTEWELNTNNSMFSKSRKAKYSSKIGVLLIYSVMHSKKIIFWFLNFIVIELEEKPC